MPAIHDVVSRHGQGTPAVPARLVRPTHPRACAGARPACPPPKKQQAILLARPSPPRPAAVVAIERLLDIPYRVGPRPGRRARMPSTWSGSAGFTRAGHPAACRSPPHWRSSAAAQPARPAALASWDAPRRWPSPRKCSAFRCKRMAFRRRSAFPRARPPSCPRGPAATRSVLEGCRGLVAHLDGRDANRSEDNGCCPEPPQ